MKKIRSILAFICIITLLISFSSCSAFKASGEFREETTVMLDSLIENDFDTFYDHISGICTEEEAAELFPQMTDYLKGVTTFELELYHTSSNLKNGVTYRQEQYYIKTDNGNYYAQITVTSDVEGIAGFQIVSEEDSGIVSANNYTGTLTTMGGANLLQWLLLVFALLETAFVFFTLGDCFRHKMSKKALWILLIIFASFSFLLTLSASNINFNFNYGLIFSHTALILHASGAIQFRLFIPFGAILYWCLRKKLLESGVPNAAIPSQEDYTVGMNLQQIQHQNIEESQKQDEPGTKTE